MIRNMLTFVVSVTLLIVAGFGIYNINMTIANKLKDIAILKAEGFALRDIIQIFSFPVTCHRSSWSSNRYHSRICYLLYVIASAISERIHRTYTF